MGEPFLKRYTNIPALVYLLRKEAITFLDPKSWDDSNDSHYLSLYKKKRRLESLLALCFTETAETYHHWRSFAGGSSGVCITFNQDKLLRALARYSSIKVGSVQYLTLKEARKEVPETGKLPFIKRKPFQDESEFRIIFESKKEQLSTKDVRISLSCIEKLTLSPWITKGLAETLKATLLSIEDCENLHVSRSTLVNNSEWKRIGGGSL